MRRVWIGPTAFGLAIALAVGVFAQDGNQEEIPYSACPAAVKQTFQEETKGQKIDKVTRETEDGKAIYWAFLVIGGKTYEFGVAESGTLVEISMGIDVPEVKFSECPAAVQKTFHEEAKGAKLDVVGKDLKYGVTIYEAVVTISAKEYQIVVAEDGTLVEKSLMVEEDDLELTECPAAVQKTLKAEAKGGNVGAVTRASGIVGHVYDAEVEVGGKTYSVSVAVNGMLISKTLQEEE